MKKNGSIHLHLASENRCPKTCIFGFVWQLRIADGNALGRLRKAEMSAWSGREGGYEPDGVRMSEVSQDGNRQFRKNIICP